VEALGVTPNKGMKLSERGSLEGDCLAPASVLESHSAAYAQCSADSTGGSEVYECLVPVDPETDVTSAAWLRSSVGSTRPTRRHPTKSRSAVRCGVPVW